MQALRILRFAVPAALSALAAASPAAAQASETSASGWLVTLNARGTVSPRFSGSSEYTAFGFPTLSFRRPGARVLFSSPDDSISIALGTFDYFTIGPVLAYRAGRYDDDAPQARGVHNVRWTVEPGLFADVWVVPERLRGRFEIRRGVREEDGFYARLGFDWVTTVNAVTFAIGPRVEMADSRFMRHRYGVTAADNRANPRFAVYTPSSGLHAAGLFASATWRFAPDWAATASAGWMRLADEPGRSPIVTGIGDRNQFSFGATLSYTFSWGGLW